MLKAHFMHEPIEDNEQPQNSALKSLENQLIPSVRCGHVLSCRGGRVLHQSSEQPDR